MKYGSPPNSHFKYTCNEILKYETQMLKDVNLVVNLIVLTQIADTCGIILADVACL